MKFLPTALAAAALALAGCATASHEPPNLGRLKQQIRAYLDSGDYDRDIAAVAAKADAWIGQRAARRAPGERLAVVFDLDETLLSNWPEISGLDFGYNPAVWDAWIAEGKAPAIKPVQELYRTARRLGVEVILLSGRRERDRPGTEKNLRAIGCADYAALLLKPTETKEKTGPFKTATRARLITEGWTIVANIGDQDSDFAGGFAERDFKLPDPFYVTQ